MDGLLKVKEVADILKVSQMTVIRRCRDGSLPFIQVGNLRRIREIDLEYYLLSQSRSTHKTQVPEPVYEGPPADECGFEDDEEARQNELTEQCEKLGEMIEAEKAKKASEVKAPTPPVRITDEPGTGLYPSGFSSLSALLDVYADEDAE
ncbi:helix-turn-helix domain-containing protein [Candidatus Clostridium stratigraminis]|uniref:Helix-turn-helix domain-containing protein n=1 Tax=Candidatus Clostridium stratigraminis TaxID=3381661 RepID=A0ABW8T0N8_9CLOT